MGEIQRIKHQRALEYWSQILKEQQESGLCIKALLWDETGFLLLYKRLESDLPVRETAKSGFQDSSGTAPAGHALV